MAVFPREHEPAAHLGARPDSPTDSSVFLSIEEACLQSAPKGKPRPGRGQTIPPDGARHAPLFLLAVPEAHPNPERPSSLRTCGLPLSILPLTAYGMHAPAGHGTCTGLKQAEAKRLAQYGKLHDPPHSLDPQTRMTQGSPQPILPILIQACP